LRGVITQQVQDLAKLQAAGLPLKLIDQIQAEGPAAVHAFATASKSELEKLRIIYAAGMGAIDAEVLEEGKHQQEKGHTMVANFAKALLESSNLPVDASRQIINQMVQALVSGKIKPAALDLVQKFTEGLGTLKGISQQEGAKAVQLLANELVKGNILNKSGEIISQKVAKGIADALDIPVGKARELVERVNSTLSSSDQKAFSAGATYSREFGAGITAGQSAAISAAQAVANAVISIIQNAMFGSPRYFTYYLGQDLINQMGEGMKSRSINFRRPNILTASDQRFNSEIGRNGHTDIDLQVRLDRRRYARELDYEYSSRGK
jgi:hypothetical protein